MIRCHDFESDLWWNLVFAARFKACLWNEYTFSKFDLGSHVFFCLQRIHLSSRFRTTKRGSHVLYIYIKHTCHDILTSESLVPMNSVGSRGVVLSGCGIPKVFFLSRRSRRTFGKISIRYSLESLCVTRFVRPLESFVSWLPTNFVSLRIP